MANQTEILVLLSGKEDAATPSSIATATKTGEPTVITYLNRLKKKGYVDGGGKEWYITDAGRKYLESEKTVPVTKEDVGEDELSKFKWYGQLSGVDHDVITAVSELFQNTDMRSITEVERVLAEMNVPGTQRAKWRNLYRDYLRNTTVPEKREELYPLPSPEEVRTANERATAEGVERLDYIVEDNKILQVGAGLGMFTFKQALQVVAVKRGTVPQVAQAGGSPPAATEKVSELITALAPFINKGTDVTALKETLTAQMKLQEQAILSKIPQPVQASQPKSLLEQLTELKALGPMLKSILGIPESSSNPFTPAQVIGLDGQPSFMDLTKVLDLRKFLAEEKRTDERHQAFMALAQTARENIPDGIQAILKTVSEVKTGTEAKTPEASQPQMFECGSCKMQFGPPAGWAGQPLKCPNPACGREYSKEELLG